MKRYMLEDRLSPGCKTQRSTRNEYSRRSKKGKGRKILRNATMYTYAHRRIHEKENGVKYEPINFARYFCCDRSRVPSNVSSERRTTRKFLLLFISLISPVDLQPSLSSSFSLHYPHRVRKRTLGCFNSLTFRLHRHNIRDVSVIRKFTFLDNL